MNTLFSAGEVLSNLASLVSWSEYRAAVKQSGMTAAYESNALNVHRVFSERRHLLARFKPSAILQLVGYADFLDSLSEPEIAQLSSLSVRQLSTELRNHPRTPIPTDNTRESTKHFGRQEKAASRNAKKGGRIEALAETVMACANAQKGGAMKPGMHPADIKALLEKSGSSLADVARAVGLSRAHASKVVSGTSRSPLIEQEIARRLRLPVEAIWPKHCASTALGEILDRLLKLSISLERFDGEFLSTEPLIAEVQSIARALAPYAQPLDLAAPESVIGVRP